MLKVLSISMLSLGVLSSKLLDEPSADSSDSEETKQETIEECQAYLANLIGKWEGGGFFTLDVIANFSTDPTQFEP